MLNGTDAMLVDPACRWLNDRWEPEVWRHLMARVREGDVVADVGAHVGVYTVALARRVGPRGRVVAFEPDAANFRQLESHVRLNDVGDRVSLIQAAVAKHAGTVLVSGDGTSEVRVDRTPNETSRSVPAVAIDSHFTAERIDILKIDVEGYELEVLEGAVACLADCRRGPRLIYVEVHPYAWHSVPDTSRALLDLLERAGYRVEGLDGQPVTEIASYGEVVARRQLTS